MAAVDLTGEAGAASAGAGSGAADGGTGADAFVGEVEADCGIGRPGGGAIPGGGGGGVVVGTLGVVVVVVVAVAVVVVVDEEVVVVVVVVVVEVEVEPEALDDEAVEVRGVEDDEMLNETGFFFGDAWVLPDAAPLALDASLRPRAMVCDFFLSLSFEILREIGEEACGGGKAEVLGRSGTRVL